MKPAIDPLYAIFEHHLLNALVEEETSADFVNRVVQEYLARVAEQATINRNHKNMIEEDLKEEVTEMLRKKIYGHFSLSDFRKCKTASSVSAIKSTALRPRRPA